VSCELFEKGGRSIFLGDAHATSLMEISNCRAALDRTGEGARPHVGVAGGGQAACFYVGVADGTPDISEGKTNWPLPRKFRKMLRSANAS